jgi:hypothetical protein
MQHWSESNNKIVIDGDRLDGVDRFWHQQFSPIQKTNQRFGSIGLLKFPHGLALDLPHTFSRDLKNSSHFFERVGVAVG